VSPTNQAVNLGNIFAKLGQPKNFRRRQTIFSQGDHGGYLFYIQTGTVKLTIISRQGKEAVVGILDGGDCFGENCLSARNSVRGHSAVALSQVRAVEVERDAILGTIRAKPDVGYAFIAYLLARSAQIQADLADNLLSVGERRLARILLSLAAKDVGGRSARVSQQTLGEMIGASRQRVNYLMKRFRRLGLIDDANGLKVHPSLKRIARID
jgi:CRP/FNR family transcriptional regulator, cyclic AMP receptor protein